MTSPCYTAVSARATQSADGCDRPRTATHRQRRIARESADRWSRRRHRQNREPRLLVTTCACAQVAHRPAPWTSSACPDRARIVHHADMFTSEATTRGVRVQRAVRVRPRALAAVAEPVVLPLHGHDHERRDRDGPAADAALDHHRRHRPRRRSRGPGRRRQAADARARRVVRVHLRLPAARRRSASWKAPTRWSPKAATSSTRKIAPFT